MERLVSNAKASHALPLETEHKHLN